MKLTKKFLPHKPHITPPNMCYFCSLHRRFFLAHGAIGQPWEHLWISLVTCTRPSWALWIEKSHSTWAKSPEGWLPRVEWLWGLGAAITHGVQLFKGGSWVQRRLCGDQVSDILLFPAFVNVLGFTLLWRKLRFAKSLANSSSPLWHSHR